MSKPLEDSLIEDGIDINVEGPPKNDIEEDYDEAVIDDSDDADDEIVESKRDLAQARMERRNSAGRLFKKVIPFHWAPMLTPLTEADIETCNKLEELAFANDERLSTKELVEYRIRSGGNLCFGLFNTYRQQDAKDWWIGTMEHCRLVEGSREDNAKHVLFAHFIATLGQDPIVTDANMGCPQNWRGSTLSDFSPLGHKYSGRTLCLHSFAVSPEVQGIGIGKTALKSWLQLMDASGVADQVAIVCKGSLLEFFRRFGFKHLGPRSGSVLQGDYHNMVLNLTDPGPMRRVEAPRSQREDSVEEI